MLETLLSRKVQSVVKKKVIIMVSEHHLYEWLCLACACYVLKRLLFFFPKTQDTRPRLRSKNPKVKQTFTTNVHNQEKNIERLVVTKNRGVKNSTSLENPFHHMRRSFQNTIDMPAVRTHTFLLTYQFDHLNLTSFITT